MTLIEEQVLDGRKTILLELTPLEEKIRAKISKIQLWIDEGSWFPLQQKVFHSGAATSMTARYANLSANVPVADSLFKPKWPKGTKTVKH